MSKRNLEERLRSIGREAVPAAPDRDERILQLMETAERTAPARGGYRDFAIGQLGAMGRLCLGWELIWLLIFLLVLNPQILGFREVSTSLVLLSVLPPLLILLTAEDLSRVLNRSMLELEHTTRYSVQQIMLLRMLYHGFFHMAAILIGVIVISGWLQIRLLYLMVYGYTPLLATTAIFLQIARRTNGDSLNAIARGVCTLVVCILEALSVLQYVIPNQPELFGIRSIPVWEIGCVLSMLALIYELIQFRKELLRNGTETGWNIETISR